MTLCSDISDYTWLTTLEARAILDELADDVTALHTAVAKLRSRVSPLQTHLLLEQVELRRRASEKFAQAHRMFFTRLGLEQSTDEWIARYKSQRFLTQRAGASPPPISPPTIADLCCGIGGDLMALTAQASVIGIDRDPITAHCATINSGAQVQVVDVSDFDFAGIDAWHLDPDRRATGRRTTSLQYCEPNLATIERMLAQSPNAGIKLAPATKVPTDWIARCEFEWISRDRECRQLVAWHGNLAATPNQNRATIVPAARDGAPRTITAPPNQPIPIADCPDCYIFDIDPAVLAAHLQGALAAEHNLKTLTFGASYLTGPRSIADAALSCFEIDDVLLMRTKLLAQHLRARGIGQLEIKKRGVDVDPEKLRRELKLRGNNAATLLITRLAGRPMAILAHRVA